MPRETNRPTFDPNRKRRLKTLAREIMERDSGATVDETIAELIENGDLSWEILGQVFGRAGFEREIFSPIVRDATDPDGNRQFELNNKGRALRFVFMPDEDVTGVYWRKKKHIDDSINKCEKLRKRIIDERGFDPEDQPDPWAQEDTTTFEMDDD